MTMKSPILRTALLGVILAASCTESVLQVIDVSRVDIQGGRPLLAGETVQLTAVPKDDRGNILKNREIGWSSSNAEWASVSAGGLVRALAPGTVTITASVEGTTGSTQITVVQPPPTVTTLPPTGVTTSGGVANGNVNPNGSPTTATFEYGTTESLGSECTPPLDLGSGTTTSAIKCTFTNVAPGTTIYYRAAATNAGGTSRGDISSFTTLQPPPTVVTLPATDVTSSSATTNGSVNPNGSATMATTQWGTTAALGSECTPTKDMGSGMQPVFISCDFQDLAGGLTIYYRITATSGGGTSNGSILSFTTAPRAPTVTTLPATNVTTSGGRINGSVNPNGSSTTVRFEYGNTTGLGTQSGSGNAGSGSASSNWYVDFVSLAPGTTIYYRVTAANTFGTSTGSILSFTTPTSGAVVGAASGMWIDPRTMLEPVLSTVGNGISSGVTAQSGRPGPAARATDAVLPIAARTSLSTASARF